MEKTQAASDSDAAPPRQTQTNNDASGNPQCVKKCPDWGLRRGRPVVKNNIVYILCKDILYTLCKHIVYKFLLIEALIFFLNEDRCESDKPVSSGILAYLRQSSR